MDDLFNPFASPVKVSTPDTDAAPEAPAPLSSPGSLTGPDLAAPAPIPDLVMFGIGEAVAYMKIGRHVRRAGWNGKGMSLYMERHGLSQSCTRPELLPFVVMITVTGDIVPWLCSQTDLIAEDWELA